LPVNARDFRMPSLPHIAEEETPVLTLVLAAFCVLLMASCVGAGVATAEERAIASDPEDRPL
jgi:hypothetical protein